MIFGSKTEFRFKPGMSVALDSTSTNDTPDSLKPSLGPIASLINKPGKVGYLIELSSVPSDGAITVNVLAGLTSLVSKSYTLNGVSSIEDQIDIDLTGIGGASKLNFQIVVTAASATVGLSCQADAALWIDNPVIVSGC